MRIFACIVSTCFIALSSAGCIEQRSPLEVSEIYWRAAREGDMGTLRRHLTAESLRQLPGSREILPISGVEFGQTIIDGERAWVETTVTVKAERPLPLHVHTVLFQERGQWCVDHRATMDKLSRDGELAGVIASIERLSERFGEKMDDTLDELERALPEVQRELNRLEDHIRTQIPELQRRLEEFRRKLEEVLKDPRRKPDQPVLI